MECVFVVQHQQFDDDDVKLVGVYSSEEAAKAAVERLRDLPGFREYPNGFSVDGFELDLDHWSEGFEPGKRIEFPLWGCLGCVYLLGALLYAPISRDWRSLPFILGYGVFFGAVAALARWKAKQVDFSRR